MTSYFRNVMSKLYDAVSAPVAATRDALAGRLKSIRDMVGFYYNNAKEQLKPHGIPIKRGKPRKLHHSSYKL